MSEHRPKKLSDQVYEAMRLRPHTAALGLNLVNAAADEIVIRFLELIGVDEPGASGE